jgi:transmembrane sensor
MDPKRITPKNLDALIEKYLRDECTPEERDFVDAWYASLQNDEPLVRDEVLKQTEERLGQQVRSLAEASPAKEKQPKRLWLYTGIAASILAVLTFAYFAYDKSTNKSLQFAQADIQVDYLYEENTADTARGIALPDGSLVLMSPHSNIRYSDNGASGNREVYLEGEAYFDVVRDTLHPFFVYTGNVVTRVLGTSFIVRNRGGNEKITVSVKTGKVAVYPKNTAEKGKMLVQHQEATYDQVKNELDMQTLTAPQQRAEHERFVEMHFDETPVSEVLNSLINAYHIEIEFSGEQLAECVLTSSFYEEGFHDRIDLLCTAIGATYKFTDAKVVIEGPGCGRKPK